MPKSSTELAKSDELFLAGLLIANRYRVLRMLDSDGLSYTFEAEDVADLVGGDQPKVALRLFSIADDVQVKAAMSQLERFSGLHHDTLVVPREIGQVPDGDLLAGYLYISRSLGERSLEELVNATGPLDREEARRFAAHVSDALVTLHRNDLVHMDLTPANAIRMQGWKLGEPSISRLLDRSASLRGLLVSEAQFVAPEYPRGGPAPEADIYAFGALLNYALRGPTPSSWLLDTSSHLGGMSSHDERPSTTIEPSRRPDLEHWHYLAALCRVEDPSLRPSAGLVHELVQIVETPAAPVIFMLYDGAFRRSHELMRERWRLSKAADAAGVRRELSMMVSDAAIGVLEDLRESTSELNVAALERRLIAQCHDRLDGWLGDTAPASRPQRLWVSWEEDILPPIDGIRSRLRRLLCSLHLPNRRKSDAPVVIEPEWEPSLALGDIGYRTHVRTQISNQLRILSDRNVEAEKKAGLASDPDRIAEAVLEELSLASEARNRIRAEEQIRLEELAARREGAPGSAGPTRELLEKESALALPAGGDLLYPAFQFDSWWRVRDAVAVVNRTLDADGDPWGVASWWVSANARIAGQAPRDLLDDDPDAIVEIAGAVVEPVG